MQTVSLDHLDKLAEKAFEGYIVRKDLARMFKGQYAVPTYVGEFLLGSTALLQMSLKSKKDSESWKGSSVSV